MNFNICHSARRKGAAFICQANQIIERGGALSCLNLPVKVVGIVIGFGQYANFLSINVRNDNRAEHGLKEK